MTKNEVLKIIDEVMNNREIDSIRNAILAIRDKVIDYPECSEGITDFYSEMLGCTIKCLDGVVALELRGHNELNCISPHFPDAKYVCIDTNMKLDTDDYGAYWFE